MLRNHANGDSWRDILVIYNGTLQSQGLKVPGKWTVVADARKAGTEPLASATNQLRVQPCSVLIAHSR